MSTETYSAETIRDYLLGQLAEAETERLDELSITDEECAERIRAVEHDLVDEFVRGELQGAVLEQFRSSYLTTPKRREATRIAEVLQSLDENSEKGRSPEASRGPTMRVHEHTSLARPAAACRRDPDGDDQRVAGARQSDAS